MLDQGCEMPPRNSKVTEFSSKPLTTVEFVAVELGLPEYMLENLLSFTPDPVKNDTTKGS